MIVWTIDRFYWYVKSLEKIHSLSGAIFHNGAHVVCVLDGRHLHGFELARCFVRYNLWRCPGKTFLPDASNQSKADSENIWKLSRYDLVLEYWGKTPLSCTPFMMVEHIILLIRMCIFHRKGPERQNTIVCWARSPGTISNDFLVSYLFIFKVLIPIIQ